MKHYVRMVGALLFLYSTHSWSYSGCNTESSGVTIGAPTLTVQRDIPVGTRLATPDFVSSLTLLFTCPEGKTYPKGWQHLGIEAVAVYSGLTVAGGRIYTTNIPGVGVQLAGVNATGSYRGWLGTVASIDGSADQGEFTSINGVMREARGGAAVTFYKIGDMSSGAFAQQRVGSLILGAVGSWAQTAVPVSISGLNVTVLACSLTTPTLAAPLGNIYATFFTGVGSTAGNNDFNLGLNCAVGTKVNVTMNGTQNTDTANASVLALTGAGTDRCWQRWGCQRSGGTNFV
ncbi:MULTISPECIES: fimbrial protein [unclassified Serratia (in: enterobacteria)]|uniref:fimbrial protein n=1 Tax=unclassified Serratia (in: enterobacteria) TaxID=2647522 RepID=UPI0004689CAC|nr:MULTISPECIES: hypothetical protein [unclassified Serratia (in: enterobacteria)]